MKRQRPNGEVCGERRDEAQRREGAKAKRKYEGRGCAGAAELDGGRTWLVYSPDGVACWKS